MFMPKDVFERIWLIDEAFLQSHGIRALILDIDNTLTSHGNPEIDPQAKAWIQRMQEQNIKMMILSNNNPERVKPFAENLKMDFVTGLKPMKSGYRKTLERLGCAKEECAAVGDQIFTDIWGANRMGIRSIFVYPMAPDHTFGIRLKRVLERPILHRLKKRSD